MASTIYTFEVVFPLVGKAREVAIDSALLTFWEFYGEPYTHDLHTFGIFVMWTVKCVAYAEGYIFDYIPINFKVYVESSVSETLASEDVYSVPIASSWVFPSEVGKTTSNVLTSSDVKNLYISCLFKYRIDGVRSPLYTSSTFYVVSLH